MKLLHTSDWHLGKSLYDFSLLGDQRDMLEFMLGLIDSEGIGAVIISGDIFDRPVPSAEAVRLYDDFLTRAAAGMGVPVIAIAGNHDSAARLEFGSSLYSGSGYHVFGSPDPGQEPVMLRDGFGEIFVHPLPWLHPAEIRGLLGDDGIRSFDGAYRALLEERMKRVDPAARNIAVAHGFFAGIPASAEKDMLTSDSEINVGGMDIADSGYFSAFDYTALGHLHAPQRAGGSARYSGSPLKYSLSEENQRKSCAIVEIKRKNDLNIELVPVPAARDVRSVTGLFDQLMEPSFHENKHFDDYVFANIRDTGVLYPMEKLRTLFPNLLGLRFMTREDVLGTREAPGADSPRPGVLELFKRFYRDARSVEMPQDRLDFLLEVMEKSEVEVQ